MSRIDQINEALDALGSDPSATDLEYATRGYDKRDVAVAFAQRALAAGEAVGSVPNPVSETAWDIVATPEQPIALFITGPPVGTEDEYLAAIVTGEPDYEPLFFLWKNGGITISPSSPLNPALSLESAAADGSVIHRVSSALGEILSLAADGSLVISQPGVGPVLSISSAGVVTFGDVATPEIPATPDAQDVADVLVALGLATQEEA